MKTILLCISAVLFVKGCLALREYIMLRNATEGTGKDPGPFGGSPGPPG